MQLLPRSPTPGESIAVLSTQMVEVIRDVERLRGDMAEHREEHQVEAQRRVISRRWLIAAVIAAIAAVDGPVVTVILAHGRLCCCAVVTVCTGYLSWTLNVNHGAR